MSSFQKPAFMSSKTTGGIKVTVEAYYQPDYSKPAADDYTFAYRITLENYNSFPVQLLRRHWLIFDSTAELREVAGDGVAGSQPMIYPGESYQYVSGCNLTSDMGKMEGDYLMENTHSKRNFKIHIPSFEMVAPFKLN